MPCSLHAGEATPETYAKDVEFLLSELERKAGHFFGRKGVDWAVVARQFREEVKAVKTDTDHVRLCQRLVARLRDGHAGLRDFKAGLAEAFQPGPRSGPGVRLLIIGDKVYVRLVSRSAQQRGIKIGHQVVSIEGRPAIEWLRLRVEKMRDEQGYSTDHQALYAACHWGLADREGTSLEIELADGQQRKTVRLTRQGDPNYAPFGPVFLPQGVKRMGRQSYGKTAAGLGYIHLRDVPGTLPEQLDTMLESLGAVPGLILDMRANGGGGCDHRAVFGRFVAQGTNWLRYASAGLAPFSGPLVVIVDSGTRSAGETVAGMLKEDGRAYMIGDGPTAGTSSQKEVLAVPSGLFSVQFSVRSNMGRFNHGRGLEGIGIPPQEVTPYEPAELEQGIDSQIRQAEVLLQQGLPKDQVPYEASRLQSR